MAALLGALVVGLSIGAAGAGAIAVRLGPYHHGFGVTPRRGADPRTLAGAHRSALPSGSESSSALAEPPGGDLKFLGGPVMHGNTTHVVYWDPNKEFTATTKGIVGKFFTAVAHDSGLASNMFAVDAQYTDATGSAAYSSTYAGALEDTSAYPKNGCTVPQEVDLGPPYTACLTDAQLQERLSRFITEKGLPKGSAQLYFVLLPHKVVTCLPEEAGVHVCSNNYYCAYHSYIEPGTANEIIYADIPFSLLDEEWAKGCQFDENEGIQTPNGDRSGSNASTRFADVALKYISHEYSEAITDPLVEYETAWVDSKGYEDGDKCNAAGKGEDGLNPNAFLPTLGGKAAEDNLYNQEMGEGHFYLQSEWDNAAKQCLMQPAPLTAAQFTYSPTTPSSGSPVSFSGSVTDPYAKPTFSWTFGDGGSGSGSKPSHTYASAGSYAVKMIVKDALTGSTAAPVEHTVVVTSPVSAPSVVTVAASSLGSDSATLNGTVNPNGGQVSECRFEYGQSSSYGASAPCASAPGAGTSAVAVAAALSGLAPNTTYHFRLVAANAGGTAPGADQTFTTLQAIAQTSQPSAETALQSSAPAPQDAVAGFSSSLAPPLVPDSGFLLDGAVVNRSTGVITFMVSVRNPGTLRWLLTFQNGKFGAFASRTGSCKRGFVRVGGRCRPARIVFARGSMAIAAPGVVTFTVGPSASGRKALRNALKHKKGVPLTATLSFGSAFGAATVTHATSFVDRERKG